MSGHTPDLISILARLTEKVERANAIQHSGGKVIPEDWSELYMLTNEARATISKVGANAQLIAAAPELLEALKVSLAWWDTRTSTECDYWADKHTPVFVEAARAAVLKAEGK